MRHHFTLEVEIDHDELNREPGGVRYITGTYLPADPYQWTLEDLKLALATPFIVKSASITDHRPA